MRRAPRDFDVATAVDTLWVSSKYNRGIQQQGGYGAMAARLTPDQKVGSSNLSGLRTLPAAWPLLARSQESFGVPWENHVAPTSRELHDCQCQAPQASDLFASL